MSQPLKLLIATSNAGKLRELHAVLKQIPLTLLSLDETRLQSVPETGATFTENAAIKATGYARQAKLLTLADDSGLEVAALGGAPGIYSARYLGEDIPYPVRIEALLKEMSSLGESNRRARFVCAIAIANSGGEILNMSVGICDGLIAESPRGSGGFGYDPIFIPSGHNQTFGELPSAIKNEISHRARALRAARQYLLSLTEDSRGR